MQRSRRESDDEYDEAYCRWAERRYGIEGVTKVGFDLGQSGPYSDVTPDVDAYVVVSVTAGAVGLTRCYEEIDPHVLINSIAAFMATS